MIEDIWQSILHLLYLLFDQGPHLFQDSNIMNIIKRLAVKVYYILMRQYSIQNRYGAGIAVCFA